MRGPNASPIIRPTQGALMVVCCLLVALVVIIRSFGSNVDQMDSLIQPDSQLAQVSSGATLNFSPANNSTAVGTTFTVSVVLNTGGQSVYGVDINQLRFNPTILQIVDVDSATAGVQVMAGTLMGLTIVNSVDNTNGTLQFSQVANQGVTYNGSGTLLTITFRVISAGTAAVTLDFTAGSGLDCNVAGLGVDLLGSVGSGSYIGTPIVIDTTPPTTPGTPVLTVNSASNIGISWTAATDNIGVASYRLERCSGSVSCSTFAQIAAPTTVSYTDTGLSAGTIYRYRVQAVDVAGNLSAYSIAANTTTLPPPDTTPPTISSVTLSNLTGSQATISWTTDELADTQVDYGPTSSYASHTTLVTTLTTAHSVLISGLSAGTAYHYRVKSKDAANNLAMSIDNVFATVADPDETAPPAPTGLVATPTSESEIQLSWNPSVDAGPAGQTVSGVVRYRIMRNGNQIDTTTTTAYLDSGLSAGTSYEYRIIAIDAADNTSVASSATTAATPLLSQAVQRRIIVYLQGVPTTRRNISGTIEFINTVTGARVYQSSITTDTSGIYTINVPAGMPATVTFRAVIVGYLSKLLPSVDLRNTSLDDVTLPTLPVGDFNGDQHINAVDYSYMNSAWGKADALADVNRDGIVNSIDFSYLSNNWLLAGE